MWKFRLVLARFPRGSWKEGEACLWLSTLSTAPAFPPLSFFGRDAVPDRLALGFLLLPFLGVLNSVGRDVQLDAHPVIHQSVDRRRRHHGVFEDGFPFREQQIAGHQHAAAFLALDRQCEYQFHVPLLDVRLNQAPPHMRHG